MVVQVKNTAVLDVHGTPATGCGAGVNRAKTDISPDVESTAIGDINGADSDAAPLPAHRWLVTVHRSAVNREDSGVRWRQPNRTLVTFTSPPVVHGQSSNDAGVWLLPTVLLAPPVVVSFPPLLTTSCAGLINPHLKSTKKWSHASQSNGVVAPVERGSYRLMPGMPPGPPPAVQPLTPVTARTSI